MSQKTRLFVYFLDCIYSLINNEIGDVGSGFIAEVLKENKSIKSLEYVDCIFVSLFLPLFFYLLFFLFLERDFIDFGLYLLMCHIFNIKIHILSLSNNGLSQTTKQKLMDTWSNTGRSNGLKL